MPEKWWSSSYVVAYAYALNAIHVFLLVCGVRTKTSVVEISISSVLSAGTLHTRNLKPEATSRSCNT